VVMGGISVLMGSAVAIAAGPVKSLAALGMCGGMSLLSYGADVVRQPRWARERERQMEALAEYAAKLLSERNASEP